MPIRDRPPNHLTGTPRSMFDSEFMQKLEYLSLVSRRVFHGELLAQKRSRLPGSGVEFADHRDYAFGDDLRYLDWNVFARFGSRLVKRFEEEEDLHISFFVDCSRSMAGGRHGSKFDYARQVAAALAYIALADLDRVGVVAFADRITGQFPLIRGKQHILSLLRFLESLELTGTSTDLLASVRAFLHRKPHTGLVVILSDFYDPAGFQKAVDTLRYQRFEPYLIQIHDPAEASPDYRGDLRLEDIESGRWDEATIDENVLRRYKEKFSAFLDSLRRYCRGNGLSCTISPTSVPFDELILRMMREAGSVAER